MKKILSLVFALTAALALAVPVFAVESPMSGTSGGDDGRTPLSLYDNSILSRAGTWDSVRFSAVPGHGDYVQFYFYNNTDEAVKVYFYRTDLQFGSAPISPIPVKLVEIPANSGRAAVFHGADAGSGTYFIRIEAYVSGGLIDGNVAVSQYVTNPGT